MKNTTRDPSGSCNIISPKEKYSLPSFLQMLGHKYRWLIKQWKNTELLFGKHIHTPSFIWAILPIIRFHAFAAPSSTPRQERLLVATAGCVLPPSSGWRLALLTNIVGHVGEAPKQNAPKLAVPRLQNPVLTLRCWSLQDADHWPLSTLGPDPDERFGSQETRYQRVGG